MFPSYPSIHMSGITCGLLAVLSFCLVLNLGSLLFSAHVLSRGMRNSDVSVYERPRELPLAVRTVQGVFYDETSHYGLEGARAEAEWNASMPAGKGFIYIGNEIAKFQVSMWHQMHCLNHIRNSLVNGDDGSHYTAHCFHYLRQSILCASDTTLESDDLVITLTDGSIIATGEGTTHTCRDWKQIYDWVGTQH